MGGKREIGGWRGKGRAWVALRKRKFKKRDFKKEPVTIVTTATTGRGERRKCHECHEVKA